MYKLHTNIKVCSEIKKFGYVFYDRDYKTTSLSNLTHYIAFTWAEHECLKYQVNFHHPTTKIIIYIYNSF